MQPNLVNEINTTRVLQKIWRCDGISRADLSREVGLVKSTVTRIVNTLLDSKMVLEGQDTISSSGVGRRPLGLKINSDYGYVLGLEIQTDFYQAVAVNFRGEVIFTKSNVFKTADLSIFETFKMVIEQLRNDMDLIKLPLLGIGLGLAGIVDQENGIILQSNPFNVSITKPECFLEKIIDIVDVPVIVTNDANSCCYGELIHRKHLPYKDFIFLLGEFRTGETSDSDYWGLALGFGFVINGKVYRGASGSAGEFQSILWKSGNEGQLSLCDDEARRIKNDDKVMEKAFRELSSHTAFLVNTMNFSHIIIGGEIAEHRDKLEPILKSEIQMNWSYSNDVTCDIVFSSLGRNAVAFGAAGLFLEKIFSIPQINTNLKNKKSPGH